MRHRCSTPAGAVLVAQGDLDGARQHFERELALSQALGNPVQTAFAIKNLGNVLAVQGELTAARRRYEEAFAAFHKAGDASSAAEAMAASADVSARLGDLRIAWERSAQAMAAKQQAGDRIGVGRIFGLRSRLAYQLGDLAASRALAGEQLQIARQTGARSLTALALQNRGRAELAAGNLAAARSELVEALRVSSALGEELRAMEIRLDLAALALAGDQVGEAAVLARQAAAWYQQRGIPGGESEALSVLAESLLRQGLRREAQATAARARVRLDASEDRELRICVSVRLGKIEAGTGNAAEALRQLPRAVADAASFGLVTAGLEARLALGEVQRGAGDPAAAPPWRRSAKRPRPAASSGWRWPRKKSKGPKGHQGGNSSLVNRYFQACRPEAALLRAALVALAFDQQADSVVRRGGNRCSTRGSWLPVTRVPGMSRHPVRPRIGTHSRAPGTCGSAGPGCSKLG